MTEPAYMNIFKLSGFKLPHSTVLNFAAQYSPSTLTQGPATSSIAPTRDQLEDIEEIPFVGMAEILS